MRAWLIKTKSSYHGLREYILSQLFLVPYSLWKTESFLSSSTHLIYWFSSKAILIIDAKNILKIIRCCIKNSLLSLQKKLQAENLRESNYHQMVEFPCIICENPVAFNHHAVCCDKCNCWMHIYCNNFCKQTYRKLKKDSASWYFKSSLKKEIQFSDLKDTEFAACTNEGCIIPKKILYDPTILCKRNVFTENKATSVNVTQVINWII